MEYIASCEKQGDVVIADEFASQVVRYYLTLAEKDERRQFRQAELLFPWPDETDKKGQPTPKEVVERLPSKSRIWIIAEAGRYHRVLTSTNSALVNELINVLMNSRRKLYHLQVPRLTVVCFSEEP